MPRGLPDGSLPEAIAQHLGEGIANASDRFWPGADVQQCVLSAHSEVSQVHPLAFA